MLTFIGGLLVIGGLFVLAFTLLCIIYGNNKYFTNMLSVLVTIFFFGIWGYIGFCIAQFIFKLFKQ